MFLGCVHLGYMIHEHIPLKIAIQNKIIPYTVGTTINHPPVITMFIVGINHSQSWVVYDSVLPTFIVIQYHLVI